MKCREYAPWTYPQVLDWAYLFMKKIDFTLGVSIILDLSKI